MVRGFEIPQYSFIFNYNLMEVLYLIVYSLFLGKKKKFSRSNQEDTSILKKKSRRRIISNNENQFEEKPNLKLVKNIYIKIFKNDREFIVMVHVSMCHLRKPKNIKLF